MLLRNLLWVLLKTTRFPKIPNMLCLTLEKSVKNGATHVYIFIKTWFLWVQSFTKCVSQHATLKEIYIEKLKETISKKQQSILKYQNIKQVYIHSSIFNANDLPLSFILQKNSEIPIFRVVKAHRSPILPRVAGKFCLCAGNQANKRADGTMERVEPRPITEDEFCVLGNLLKIQNC